MNDFKIGGIYEILFEEDFYIFIEKNQEEYTTDELAGAFKTCKKGDTITYIKTITEVRRKGTLKEHREQIPVFYMEDCLMTPYSTVEQVKVFLKEVVDDNEGSV